MQNLSVNRTVKKLGRDIKSARLRRRLPMALVAERAGISVRTLGSIEKGETGVSIALGSIEKGETGVSIGNVTAVILAMGMGTPFADILDQKNDSFGLLLDEERLPKRARLPKTEKTIYE